MNLKLLLSLYIVFYILPNNAICNSFNNNDSIVAENEYWETEKSIRLHFSQSSYSNYYKGGGLNAIAIGTHFKLNTVYKKDKKTWASKVNARYGIAKLGENGFLKNDDLFELDSKYGIELSKHINFSTSLNFRTNFHDTYQVNKIGEKGQLIGNFLAPAYLNIGCGFDYVTNEKILRVYYTPINSKITYVGKEELVEQYLPEKDRNKKARYELGSLVKLEFKKEIMTNVILQSEGNFFTNHLDGFGKFDVRVENEIKFKINKGLSANLQTDLIYDEDILFDLETSEDGPDPEGIKGPRTQFKELFNIGFTQVF